MKLRKFLDHLTSVRGLMSEEKGKLQNLFSTSHASNVSLLDPEEFLNSLLTQTLKVEPFLELSSGQTAHLYQLFVERDESLQLPSVQDIFAQSFRTSNVKLRQVPSVLILQMPRFGRQFKVYDRILPSQYLDVTDVIENGTRSSQHWVTFVCSKDHVSAPRQCIICGKIALLECQECFGNHTSGLDSTAFCEPCLVAVHNHHKRRDHKAQKLKLPKEFFDT